MRLVCCLSVLTACTLIAADAPSPREQMRAAMEASVAKQMAAVALQRASVAGQIAAAEGFFLLPGPVYDASAPAVAPSCDPLPQERLAPLLGQAATREGLRLEVLRSVVEQESGFRPCAVSPKGAMGLMQLMPATAQRFGVLDPFDPKQNIDSGAKFLKQLLTRYGGDLAKALAAYNAGPAKVDASGGIPRIAETVNYVQEVMGNLPDP